MDKKVETILHSTTETNRQRWAREAAIALMPRLEGIEENPRDPAYYATFGAQFADALAIALTTGTRYDELCPDCGGDLIPLHGVQND